MILIPEGKVHIKISYFLPQATAISLLWLPTFILWHSVLHLKVTHLIIIFWMSSEISHVSPDSQLAQDVSHFVISCHGSFEDTSAWAATWGWPCSEIRIWATSPQAFPACWAPLCLPDTISSSGHHYHCETPPTSLLSPALPVDTTAAITPSVFTMHCCPWLEHEQDAMVALCAPQSSIHETFCAFCYSDSHRYQNRAVYVLVFLRDSIKMACSIKPRVPSFLDAVESIESWAGVKSKGNKLLRHSNGYITELILSASLPVHFEWVSPKKSLAPGRLWLTLLVHGQPNFPQTQRGFCLRKDNWIGLQGLRRAAAVFVKLD